MSEVDYELEVNTCKEVLIDNNFKKFKIRLSSSEQMVFVLTDLTVKQDLYCQKDSLICAKNVVSKEFNFQINYCTPKLYIYACNTLSDKKVYFKLNNYIIEDKIGCNTLEIDRFSRCSSFGLDNCKNARKCTNHCNYVECRTNAKDPSTSVFKMCYPTKNSTLEEITSKCLAHSKFEGNATNVHPFIFQCKNKHDGEDMDFDPNSSMFKFMVVLAGVVILGIFIASVYYRFKVKSDGEPPFHPPYYVPNFIFPRNP